MDIRWSSTCESLRAELGEVRMGAEEKLIAIKISDSLNHPATSSFSDVR